MDQGLGQDEHEIRSHEDWATTRRRRRGAHEPPRMAVRGVSGTWVLNKMRAGLQGVFTLEHPCRSPRRRKMMTENACIMDQEIGQDTARRRRTRHSRRQGELAETRTRHSRRQGELAENGVHCTPQTSVRTFKACITDQGIGQDELKTDKTRPGRRHDVGAVGPCAQHGR